MNRVRYVSVLLSALCFAFGIFAQDADDLFPYVASNDPSFAVIVWLDDTGGDLYGASFTGGRWSRLMIIPDTDNAFPSSFELLIDSSNTTTAIWADYGQQSIRTSTFPFKRSWSSAQTISPDGQICQYVSATIDASGTITAIWFNDSGGYLQTSSKPMGGSWTDPVIIHPGS